MMILHLIHTLCELNSGHDELNGSEVNVFGSLFIQYSYNCNRMKWDHHNWIVYEMQRKLNLDFEI